MRVNEEVCVGVGRAWSKLELFEARVVETHRHGSEKQHKSAFSATGVYEVGSTLTMHGEALLGRR